MLRYQGRLCVPDVDDLRNRVLEESYGSRYSIHPGYTKMYRDLREVYWWDGLKRDITEFVASCPNFQQVKIEHLKPSGLTLGSSYLEVGGNYYVIFGGVASKMESKRLRLDYCG